MRHDLFFAPLEVKFAADEAAAGTFSGYGAVFGNVDAYGDVIQKGAFKDTLRDWKKQKRQPPMLIQHGGWGLGDMDGLAIGKWTSMEEDDTGLAVEGKLIGLDTERGKIIHGAMKEGVLDGMSIGYRAKEFTLGTKPEEPRRLLKKIDLVELSVVQMPANGAARVAQVKSAGIRTIREFEEFLRDAGGFSHAAAKAIAACGFKASDPRDEDGADRMAALVRRNTEKLTT
ncbi:HK97 family phage prohead protease [Mesorhizobium sp.]|uniref:HK97 family phage prohead protease n=1 Tax=Mesorhizobium sp. TaxID=1871066 RepID=UPI00122AAD0E|nr:HK97 family phage prohead protease [Mesorhizobium sp.]TIR00839.1 MAG: HK97 family phage prohead protease [Mesorhizobium sp.]